MKKTFLAASLLILALGPARAQASLSEKRQKLIDTADFIRSLSDDDYEDVSRAIMKGGRNPRARYFASRPSALKTVYGTLAALDYHAAEEAGLPSEKAEEASSSYKALTKDVEALAVNPETLVESGWWSDVVQGLGESSVSDRRGYRGTAIAGVRGGRKIETETDKKIAKLNDSLKKIDASYQTADSAAAKAELRLASAQIYRSLAAEQAAPAPVEKRAKPVPAPVKVSGGELSPKAVYQRASPAVVLVMCTGADGNGELGTGSVINDGGQILTNAHVVIRASTKAPYERIRVYFKPAHVTGDTKRDLVNPSEAKVLSYDRALDLAVLELEEKPSDVTLLPLGDSEAVDAGEPVVAIGHPEQGGLWTLTTGVVSTVLSSLGGVKGKDVFQTDASINRGNSGGPLIDRRGALIGVNTSMARKAADGLTITSVNFSVKSSVVKNWLAGAGLGGRYTVMDAAAPVAIAAAEPETVPQAEVEAPPVAEEKPAPVEKPAAAAKPAPEPKTPAPAKPAILTPKRPFKIADVIEQQMAEMEDFEKEMSQEVEKRRGEIEAMGPSKR